MNPAQAKAAMQVIDAAYERCLKKMSLNSKTTCLLNCVYRAPISYEVGKIWCALKGAYIEPDKECDDYKERKS